MPKFYNLLGERAMSLLGIHTCLFCVQGCGARLKSRKPAPTGGAAKPPELTQELAAAAVAARMERGQAGIPKRPRGGPPTKPR